MDIKTNQIGDLLRDQIKNIDNNVDVNEVGEVLEIGDGVARTSGLGNVMSSELVEFPNNVFGMALNLEEENVGVVLFGDSSLVKEGDIVKRTGKVVEVNEDLNDTPEQVNEDPYKNGWMVKIELDNNADQSKLLDAKSYIELIG